jgi:TonB-dependent receptor
MLLASSMLAAGIAHAQETPSDEAQEAAGAEIVVTGTAMQNREAIAQRRNSPLVVDALVQDDTGDLADQSLSEALARMPAVSTMQVLYGEQESQYVAVRGITPDLNYVSVDGIGMISVANQGAGQRRVDLALIPSQAARKTEVYKTFAADKDAGAIGGIINIVPHSAFAGRDKFFIDAFASYTTDDDVPGSNSLGKYNDTPWGGGVKGLLTKRFGANDEFGLVLSGSFTQRTYDETKRNPNGRAYYTASGATTTPDNPNYNGFEPAPTAFVSYDFTSFVQTYGGTAALEYKPGDDWHFSLLAYDYFQLEDQTNPAFNLRAFTGITDQTQYTGTLRVPDVRTTHKYDRFENESRGIILKAEHGFGDGSRMAFRAGYNDNSFYDAENEATYQARPTNQFVTYDVSDRSARFTLSDSDALMNPAAYSLLTAGDTLYEAKGKAYEARIDFSRNAQPEDLGFGYAAGLGVRRFEMDRDVTVTNFTTDRSALTPVAYDPNFVPWLFNYNVLWVDYARFAEGVKPNLAVNQASSRTNSLDQDYSYDETISYGYLSANWANERTRVIAGLRMDVADYGAETPLVLGGVYQDAFTKSSGSYQYLLPSLNLVHGFSDDVRLKAAYSRTLGRPAPEDIARPETRNDTSFTINRGNPQLAPRRSDNFDLTLEYFFNGSNGLVSLGAFAKNINDDIYDLKEEQLIDGFVYTITTPMNANQSKMRGLEFQLIDNSIGWLPGFLKNRLGFSFNVTRIWGQMDYVIGDTALHIDRLLYQREWMGNAALFYKLPAKGEVRVAYSYGDGYYDGIGASPWLHRGPEGRGSLDTTVRLTIADDWIVKFQAKNLLGEDVYLGYGEDLRYRRAEMNRGRQFFVNLIYRP